MGAQGVYVSSADFNDMVSSPKVEVIDTTAAGDTFNGALVVALAEGQPLEEATRFAVKAAALSVTKLGAQASTPSRSDLNQLNS